MYIDICIIKVDKNKNPLKTVLRKSLKSLSCRHPEFNFCFIYVPVNVETDLARNDEWNILRKGDIIICSLLCCAPQNFS